MSKRRRSRRGTTHTGIPRDVMNTLGLSPEVAAIKAKATPKQWAQIRHAAHKRGLSVAGYVSGQPAAMREALPSALKQQAMDTIASVYKPAEADLSARERRVKAIDEKRHNDNQSYLQWLQGQSAKMTADAKLADQLLVDRQKGIQQQTTDAYAQLHQQAATAAASHQGVVSDPTESTAMDFTDEGKRAEGLIATARESTTNMIDSNAKLAATAAANNFAHIASLEAKRASDTWGALSDVADERTKLQLQKGADAAKEVARLLDQEITKAQSNREFGAALQKLGIQAQTLQFNKDKFSKQFGLEKSKFALELKKFMHQAHIDRLKIGIDERRLQQDANQFDRSLAVKWYVAKHPASSRNQGGKKYDIKGNNQYAFDTAVASIISGTYRPHGSKKTRSINHSYVAQNPNAMIATLMTQLGVTRRMATAAVRAFLNKGSADPGDYTRYLHPSTKK